MRMCLLSTCVPENGGIHLTELLPCSNMRDTNTDTQTDERHCSDGLSCHDIHIKFHKDRGRLTDIQNEDCIRCPQQKCIVLEPINCTNCHGHILNSVNVIFSSEIKSTQFGWHAYIPGFVKICNWFNCYWGGDTYTQCYQKLSFLIVHSLHKSGYWRWRNPTSIRLPAHICDLRYHKQDSTQICYCGFNAESWDTNSIFILTEFISVLCIIKNISCRYPSTLITRFTTLMY
jgi:hypothetical protein